MIFKLAMTKLETLIGRYYLTNLRGVLFQIKANRAAYQHLYIKNRHFILISLKYTDAKMTHAVLTTR